MDIVKPFNTLRDYIQGFLEVANIDTHRYSFVINNLDIVYPNSSMKTKFTYTPVGCYRPFYSFAAELNDEVVCRKFKPEHARIIIGIDTLEKTLNFDCKDQVTAYLAFVEKCMNQIRSFNNEN